MTRLTRRKEETGQALSPLPCLLICISFLVISLMFVGQSDAKIDPDTVVGIWLFNEGKGDIAQDSSENGNDGKFVGDPQWVDGKFGGALEFDGATHVEIPDAEILRLGKEQTVTGWIYLTEEPTGWHRIVGKGADPNRNYGLWVWDTNHLLFQIYGAANCNAYNPNFDDKESLAPTGEWTHMAGTYDGEEIKLFVNGVEVEAVTAVCEIEPNQSEEPLIFGNFQDAYFYTGILDEVGIFREALSGDEINNIMSKGLAGIAAVSPSGKLAATWASIKK